MSDKYFEENRTTHLAFWGLGQMLKGAGYALAFVLVIGIFLGLIYLVGQLLPEESKTAPAPMGAVETVVTAHIA
jgi:hypothetical protein